MIQVKEIYTMQKDLENINDSMVSPVSYTIDLSNWVLNNEEGIYEYTLSHNKNISQEDINVKFYEDKEIASVGYEFIDNNSIKVHTRTSKVIVAVILVPLVVQDGNAPNLSSYYTKNEIDAKTDAISNSLNEIDAEMFSLEASMLEMEERLVENDAKQFLQADGTGSVTVRDSLNGYVKDLKILGNTTGGYNSETSTSFPLTSVGEAENNRISILSTGKNLLDIGKATYGMRINENNGLLANPTEGGINGTGNGYSDYIKIQGFTNLKYIITNGRPSYMPYALYDSNKNFIQGSGFPDKGKNISIPSNCEYIRVTVNKDSLHMLEVSDISSQESPYEEYKADKKDILIPVEFGSKGLPNGVADECYWNGDYLQKVKRVVLNGSEEITYNAKFSDGDYMAYIIPISDRDINSVAIVDKFKYKNSAAIPVAEQSFWCERGNTSCYISIKKTELVTSDVDGFKKWLQANPTTVYYELAEPILHKIQTIGKLSTFKTITTLTVETEVEAKVNCKIPVSTPAVIKRLQDENKSLREEVVVKNNLLDKADLSMLESNLDLDFRITDIEIALETTFATGVNSSRAMSPYDMMKTLILNNHYDKADLDHKISVYLKHGRITAQEAQELYDLMEIYPGRS